MNINTAEIQALAQAAKDNPYDGVALNDYGMAMAPAVTLALLAQLAEADRLAGEATRTKQDLAAYKRTVSTWMVEAAVAQGHSRNKPFDQVWEAILQERNQLKAENERLRKLPTCWSEVLEQSEANDQLLDQVLALSADADRYRFLRDLAGSQDIRYPLTGTPVDIDATIDSAMAAARVYRCHKCNATTPPPEPFKAYVTCKCGAMTAATAALVGRPAPGAFAFQAFAWLYTKPGTVPGTLDVQIELTKQDYPGYTATALYTGPVNGEPAGWAYRVKLGAKPTSWRVSMQEPCFSGDPGDIEVMPLYKGESVTSEVPV